MGRCQELGEFKHGTVLGCHLCYKSIHEISLLLNIPRSTVSGIITRWKQLGTTATQPQSGRPRKMTEQGVGLGPLVQVKGTLKVSAYQGILDNFILPTLWK
ncbi:unnamed protein product [Staurois parvus]|uniref:Transposase n=1 Tax=Staurois parvus TaxID=386267 RepID=A0ABN9H0U9_9NEOB|nr:unnamed protein product [Staurois parvus]